MKFLCPSCKAKYQIADKKVAGRSVRMKCRKCGFVIPLSEIPPAPTTVPPEEEGAAAPVVPKAPLAPTGTASVGAKAPAVAPARPASPASPASPAVGPPKPAVPARRPTLADVAIGAPKPGAPVVRPAAPGTPSAGIPAPPSVSRPAAPAARSTSKGPLVPKPAGAPAVTPAASAAAAAVAPAAASAAAVSLLSALEEEEDENDDATHILKGGALADAFGALVGGSPATIAAAAKARGESTEHLIRAIGHPQWLATRAKLGLGSR